MRPAVPCTSLRCFRHMIGQYYDALPVFYLRALLWRTWLSCVLVCLDDCHTHQLIARAMPETAVDLPLFRSSYRA